MLSKISCSFSRIGFGLLILLVACSTAGKPADATQENTLMTFELTSPAFTEGTAIPSRYSCDGSDISPALQWQNLPGGTASLALIMDDPDAPAGTWVHWVAFDIPAEQEGLPEQVEPAATIPGGGVQGNNSWRRLGYGGPCPPGDSHRYFFKLYALDTTLNLQPGATKNEVVKAMESHILAQAQLMGTYQRQ